MQSRRGGRLGVNQVPANKNGRDSGTSNGDPAGVYTAGSTQLRLYVARSTPNSLRAEQNLAGLLDVLEVKLTAEIIDVFTNAKRAVVDGVIVTPTLVIVQGNQRHTIVGDLSDNSQLRALLEESE